MENFSLNQVVIYHDETKDVAGRNFKGHILFFVPLRLVATTYSPLFGVDISEYSPHELLYNKIVELRKLFSCDGKLHFSQISGKTWKKYDFAYRNSLDVTTDGLRHKGQKEFPQPLHCKVAIIFYPKGEDYSIYGEGEKKELKLRHDETLLRILLKGSAHFLYDKNNQIEVKRIVTDGSPSYRNFDKERIIHKLTYESNNGRTPLRNYVTFSSDAEIIHLPSDHKNYTAGSEENKAANMLQLADLLLGAVMRSCFHGFRLQKKVPMIGDECTKRDIISQPVRIMLDKYKRGGGFVNSGHFKSFAISEVAFFKGGVNFREIHPMELSFTDTDSLQMSLFP
jgi:hypothetical protein